MKKITFLSAVFLITSIISQGSLAEDFPKGPELSVTTGKVCDTPVKYRYPENIAYCGRDVTFQTKEIVISEYDQKFGYTIAKLPRGDFKIDHLIPLCAGGSNDTANLWPQHKTIYKITDPLEPIVCEKMSLGRIKQQEAILLILEAKTNLERTPKIIQYLKKL